MSVELLAHDDAVRGVVALSFAVFRAVDERQRPRFASPAVALAISPITSFPPSPVAPTHAGCDRPCLVSSVSSPYCPMRSSPLAALLSKSVGAVGLPRSPFAELAKGRWQIPRPHLMMELLPHHDVHWPRRTRVPLRRCRLRRQGSVMQRTAHPFDRVASVWSRLVRVVPRWWCRWRRTGGVIAGER